MVDTLDKQIEVGLRQYRAMGFAELDPDRGEHLTGKFAWSGFCQGWLGMLPVDTAAQLLDRAGLTNEYVPIAVICDGCGRKVGLGSAEIPCASCGATMTLPAGADEISCPYCQSQVRRTGMR